MFRFYGSYESLHNVDVTDVLTDLTSGIPETIKLPSRLYHSTALFDKLAESVQDTSLVSVSLSVSNNTVFSIARVHVMKYFIQQHFVR